MKPPQNHEFRKDLLAYLLFAVLVLFKFWNFLLPKDKIFFSDDFVELMAMRDYFYQQLRNGFLVLWDTHLGTGIPYLSADLGALYPPDLLIGLFAVFYNIDRLQVLLAVHYWLAGVFAYLYTRQLGFFRTSAIVSALSFMLGGFLLANPQHRNLIQTFIWFPLILYFLDKALLLRKWIWSVMAGLFLAISFLAGHANFFYFILLWILFYYGFQVFRRMREKSFSGFLQDTSYFVLMSLFCLGLSAVQLLPVLLSGAGSFRESLDFGWKAHGSYPVLNLISFIIPKWYIYTASDFSDQLSYIGILPLALGLWAMAHSKDNKTTFFGLTALFSLLLAFGQLTPLYKILYDVLPGLDLFRIPSRFNCLMTFSLAILAGYGVNLLLENSLRERLDGLVHIVKVVFYIVLGAGILLVLSWFFLTSFQGRGGQVAPSETLLEGYVLFLFVLGAIYLILLGQQKGIPGKTLNWAIILLVCLDLLMISVNYGPDPGGHMSRKDPAIIPESAEVIAGELIKDRELFRVGNLKGLLPPLLRYQKNVTAYDLDSMPNYVSLQFPSEYLQLYFLIEKNPSLLDMLNVKYQIDGAKPKTDPFPDSLKVGREFGNKEFELKEPLSLSKLTMHSFLGYSESIPQGSTVARLELLRQDGTSQTVPIRAGTETAEWAIDRPNIKILHQKAPLARSLDVPNQGFKKHVYLFERDLKETKGIIKISLQYLWPKGMLEIESILLNNQNLKGLIKDRFDLTAPSTFKNNYAFPRVYTLARGKAIPKEPGKEKEWQKAVLTELKNCNPRDYVILDLLPSGYKEPRASSFSTREAQITHYSPHLIRVSSKTEEDKFLILSDTYNTYWKATIDQKPAPILRANYGLRGVYVPKGTHQVDFSFHYTPFYYGLVITGLSLGLLLILSFLKLKRFK